MPPQSSLRWPQDAVRAAAEYFLILEIDDDGGL